jgi:hypothetical protein
MPGAVLTVGTVLGVLTPITGSTAAWADGPVHTTSTMTFDDTFPAGFPCDFNYHQAGTFTDNAITFPDNSVTEHIDLVISHTNLDTNFTLTETDHFTSFTAADGQNKQVGIFWHLRNADGKIVVVQAGQLVFSATGEVLKFTPNINPDAAAVLCPALGGHPAGGAS